MLIINKEVNIFQNKYNKFDNLNVKRFDNELFAITKIFRWSLMEYSNSSNPCINPKVFTLKLTIITSFIHKVNLQRHGQNKLS